MIEMIIYNIKGVVKICCIDKKYNHSGMFRRLPWESLLGQSIHALVASFSHLLNDQI